jgi:hypothetical protein
MTTYRVDGWNENRETIVVIVDIADDEVALGPQFERAKEIAGPTSWFGTSQNLSAAEAALVPADCKGVLLKTVELYARVPELDANYRPRRRKATLRSKAE